MSNVSAMADVEDADENMLVRLDWEAQRREFLVYISTQDHIIEDIVRGHCLCRRSRPAL